MNLAILMTLPLYLGGGEAPTPRIETGARLPSATRVQDGGIDALSKAFDNEVKAWKKSIKATKDVSARAALRKQNPAKAYWPRFEALSKKGEGKALLWMAGNAKDAGISRDDLPATKQRLYKALVDQHNAAAWFDDVITSIAGEKDRYLPLEKREMLLASVTSNGAAPIDARAHSASALGRLLMASDDPAIAARGKQILASIPTQFPESKWATMTGLEPGDLAPDFSGKTIDGHEFKLSDYRGKVVLVDFYGFW